MRQHSRIRILMTLVMPITRDGRYCPLERSFTDESKDINLIHKLSYWFSFVQYSLHDHIQLQQTCWWLIICCCILEYGKENRNKTIKGLYDYLRLGSGTDIWFTTGHYLS